MLRRTALAALFLTSIPACDSKNDKDKEDDTGELTEAMTDATDPTEALTEVVAAESEGDSETEGASESSSSEGGESTTNEEPPEGDDESTTPLVLAFAGEAVHFNTAVAAGFDLTGTMSVVTDWPTSTTPWLALDRNDNGRIDDGGELFGSATLLASGDAAVNGFVALRELDDNGDGRVDARDSQWSRLLVWSDVDSDRVSARDELRPVSDRELVAIDLNFAVDRRCDGRGNCEVERASFVYRSGGREKQGAIVDVHLKIR